MQTVRVSSCRQDSVQWVCRDTRLVVFQPYLRLQCVTICRPSLLFWPGIKPRKSGTQLIELINKAANVQCLHTLLHAHQ